LKIGHFDECEDIITMHPRVVGCADGSHVYWLRIATNEGLFY
jgi:hypothetical protein